MSTTTEKTGFLGIITGFFLFKGKVIKEVTESTGASVQAFILIFLNIILTTLLRTISYFQTQDESLLGLGYFVLDINDVTDTNLIINGLISAFLSTVLFTLFIAIIMAFSANNLGGHSSMMEATRIIAFSTPILIIGSLITYLVALANITGIGWLYLLFLVWYLLIFFVAFKIGSDLSYVKTFLALILSSVLSVLVLEVLLVVVVALT